MLLGGVSGGEQPLDGRVVVLDVVGAQGVAVAATPGPVCCQRLSGSAPCQHRSSPRGTPPTPVRWREPSWRFSSFSATGPPQATGALAGGTLAEGMQALVLLNRLTGWIWKLLHWPSLAARALGCRESPRLPRALGCRGPSAGVAPAAERRRGHG